MNYEYDVSIVIVNYNGKKYLYNLFESLKRIETNGITFEIVFVDNNSKDNSIEYIHNNLWDKYLNITLIQNKENQGFAKGNNTGVEAAKGKYIVFLNNDTAVDKFWLVKLYDFIEARKECGIAASKLLFFYDFIKLSFSTLDKIIIKCEIEINDHNYKIENKFCKNLLYGERITCFGNSEISIPLIDGVDKYHILLHVEKFNQNTDFLNICGKKILIDNNLIELEIEKDFIYKNKYALIQNAGSGINQNYDGFDIGMGEVDGLEFNKEKKLDAGCGASIIIRRSDFMEIGGFDERLFMYYEDTDLSFRIKSIGKEIHFCPYSIVRHVHTGSSKEWSPFFAYHVYRNKLIFIYKNISKGVFWKYCLIELMRGLRYNDKLKRKSVVDAIKILILKNNNIKFNIG